MRGAGSTRWGFFLRAETMHGWYSYIEDNPRPPGGPQDVAFHRLSHGECAGARILEAGPWGLREAVWEDLDLVDHWRRYLAEPWSYLRHLEGD